jgi:hypothetical protein
VAHLVCSLPAVCDPSQPLPEAVFSDELPEYYFERYRAYGGMLVDVNAWRRSVALARLACIMPQIAFVGSMVRQDVRPVLAVMERQVESMLPVARALVTRGSLSL